MLSYRYDKNGNRTRITHPDNVYFGYTFDGINRINAVTENANSLITLTYHPAGQRHTLSRAGSATTIYTFDDVARLESLQQDFYGTTNDLTNSFSYNPAGQVTALTLSNDLFHYQGNQNRSGSYTPNGLNQYTHIAGQPLSYDTKGNLTNDGSLIYTYDDENRLVSTSGGATSSFKYDPLGRLHEVTINGATTRFLYDGDALVAEYNSAGTLTRRYVHGDRVDEPWVQYNNANLNYERRYLHADHQGSIIAHSNYMGSVSNRLTYDAFGIPDSANIDRFGYTGQLWFKELGLFHYKARMYSPKLGRFLQTDPIFYEDQMNLYAYVGNDPVNKIDPTGLQSVCADSKADACYSGPADFGATSDVPELPTGDEVNTPAPSTFERIGAAAKDALWDRPLPGEAVAVASVKGAIVLIGKATTNMHHAWPKYLGGPIKQSYANLDINLHKLYHKGLDVIAPRWRGTKYYEGLSTEARSQILSDFATYTRSFDAKYGTNLFETAVENGFKVVP